MLEHKTSWNDLKVLPLILAGTNILMRIGRFVNTKGQNHSLTYELGLTANDNFKHLFKATEPDVTKFYIDPPRAEGMKVCSNGPGHMTNIVAMPIYGKTFKTIFSLEPIDRWL